MCSIDTHEVLKDEIEYLLNRFRIREIQLKVEISNKNHVVLANEFLVDVFENILINAVKYNNPFGDVTIDITPVRNNRYKFSIIDTGPGLTQEEQKLLFIPFSRVGKNVNSVEGTGIGLTIPKRFVELMGGEAGVNSVVGEGATFWFTLQIFEEGKDATSAMHG